MELGTIGVRVSALALGLVYPPDMNLNTKESMKEAMISQTPLGRIEAPEDVTGPLLF
jgi:3-oxoacyl-[acyl-carrier protein] reductase